MRKNPIRMRPRIASLELFPDCWSLPHLICSRHWWVRSKSDEAHQRDDEKEMIAALAKRYATGSREESRGSSINLFRSAACIGNMRRIYSKERRHIGHRDYRRVLQTERTMTLPSHRQEKLVVRPEVPETVEEKSNWMT